MRDLEKVGRFHSIRALDNSTAGLKRAERRREVDKAETRRGIDLRSDLLGALSVKFAIFIETVT